MDGDATVGRGNALEADAGFAGSASDEGADGPEAEGRLVYGRSDAVIVFKDSDGNIQWDVVGAKLSQTQARVHYKFDILRMRIRQCLTEGKRDMYRDRMGQALFHALGEPAEDRALGYFQAIEDEVQTEAQRNARYRYLGYGSVAAAALILLGVGMAQFFIGGDAATVALSASAGATGAWMSILQRGWSLVLPPHETPAHLMLQGATRIVLGALFGIAALAAIKGGLLMPTAATSHWTLGLALFVAGWSERLVPEMISRLEGEAVTSADEVG